MMNDNFSAEAAIVPEGVEAPVYRLEAEILTQGPDGVSFDFDAADVAQQVCEAVLMSENCGPRMSSPSRLFPLTRNRIFPQSKRTRWII